MESDQVEEKVDPYLDKIIQKLNFREKVSSINKKYFK